MIRYSLICAADHGFEGWFRSSGDFETQAAGGHVTCPVCGTASVGRALMAPNVQTARRKAETPPEPPTAAKAPPAPMDLASVVQPSDPRLAAMVEMMRAYKAKVLEATEDVGAGFAEEARRIHFGEAEQRGIRGQATPDEARALLEDGVEILPIPVLPDERN